MLLFFQSSGIAWNVFIFLVKVTEWPPIGKIAAHSAYEMFSWYMYLIVILFFSHLGFWSGNLFLIAPFPDLCLLVPLYVWQVERRHGQSGNVLDIADTYISFCHAVYEIKESIVYFKCLNSS